MPEIHCWVGLVESQEIIDITVKFFPMAWKTAMGYDWLTKQPPDYLWHSVRDLEELDCMYEPIEAATHYGMQMLDVIVSQRKNKR